MSNVEINLFNSLGEKQKSLLNSVLDAGNHENIIDGSELSSGIYFCELRARSLISSKTFKSTIKIMLIK